MKKWIIGVIVVGLVGFALYDFVLKDGTAKDTANSEDDSISVEDAEIGLEKGNLAPDLELETIEGETVKLSDFRGQKVMLNFWATWCPPCRAEMPDMQKFHETYDEDEGVILGVNVTETESSLGNVESFLDEYGITFTILLDEDASVSSKYSAHALPTTYIINSQGIIENKAIGPLNYELMVQAFDEIN